MKLELKHLAPYLPYELYFMRLELICLDRTVTPVIWSNEKEFVRTQLNPVTINGFKYEENKLILQPLSDLTKDKKFIQLIDEELICGSWKFMKDDWTTSICTTENNHTLLIIQGEIAPECSVLFYNYMIKNHYDVFGLIDQNLAIDINTLPELQIKKA
jgi:hypothetical protein